MRYHRFVRLVAVVVTPLALVGIRATSAFGAGKPADGTIHVWQSQTQNSPTNSILITGVIGDYGTSTSQDKNGTVDENGNYVKISLSKGTFLVNNTSLIKAFAAGSPTLDKRNCGGVFTGSASVPVSKGTGAYVGIKGTLRITVTSAFIQPQLASGKCNFAAAPLSTFTMKTGFGHVTF